MKVKDKYLLCYFEFNEIKVKALNFLQPLIEEAFPGIELFVSYSDAMCETLDDTNNIVKRSSINEKEKRKYAYVRELKGDNPIKDFLKESDLCYLENKLPEYLHI